VTPHITISLTKTGWGLILGSLFLYSSARSNDNNLLYLIGAASFAIVVSHFIAGWRNLSGLSVSWQPPDEGFVGSDLNPVLLIDEKAQRSHFQLSMGQDYLENLGPGQTFSFHGHFRLERRGCERFSQHCLWSLYPFGLARFTVNLPPVTVWAYPQPQECQIFGVQESMQSSRQPAVDSMGDYWMLREYREGEDARQINWHSSAKTDAEWILVLAQPRQEPFRIWIDFRGLQDEALETFFRRISGLILRLADQPIAMQLWVAKPPVPFLPGWFDLREGPNRRIAWRWLAGLNAQDAESSVPPNAHEGFSLSASHLSP